MSIFNTIVTSSLNFLPRWFAKPFASPYVAGESIKDALTQVRSLNNKGFSATVDILGEHVLEKKIAKSITLQYCQVYEEINSQSLDCNISVKPTHIGLSISMDEVLSNMITLLEKAKEYNNFLRIDMEDSSHTDDTFNIFENCKPIYSNIGIVIQSYLHRSAEDLKRLANRDFNSRLCKGIYKESPSIAFNDKTEINNNYLLLARLMIERGSYAGFATHDQTLIEQILDWVKKENVPKDCFEFQVLFGVPMDGRLEKLIEKGYKVRVYVPFGPDWFDYSVRRLKENPDIAKYVFLNLIKK